MLILRATIVQLKKMFKITGASNFQVEDGQNYLDFPFLLCMKVFFSLLKAIRQYTVTILFL